MHHISELNRLWAAVRYANALDRARFKKAISTASSDTASIHQRLMVTVPAARHLGVYLTQIRTGQPTRTFEEAPMKLIETFWVDFVQGRKALPEEHELLKAPLSVDLVRSLALPHHSSGAQAARMQLTGSTLGELIKAYECWVVKARDLASAQQAEERRAAAEVAVRVRSLLTVEEYQLLCKHPGALTQPV